MIPRNHAMQEDAQDYCRGVSLLLPTLLVDSGCLVELMLLNFHVSDPGLPAAAG